MTHRPPRSPRPRRRGRTLAVAALACLGGAALTASGATAATPDQIRTAIERGADYLQTQQSPDGRFLEYGGDWGVSSLVAAGRDADAIRPAPGAPSALAAYRTLWTGGPDDDEDWTTPSGPDPFAPVRYASDYARAALISHAIGLDPTRLSADQNLIAQLAGVYHGRQPSENPAAGRIEGSFGDPEQMSNVVGPLFALSRQAVPQVLLDTIADTLRSNQMRSGSQKGAWGFARLDDPAAFFADFDTTGQAIGALCAVGVPASDPAIVDGLAYLRSAQTADGGLTTGWDPGGDVNTTATAVFAMDACGIDPQSPAWTAASGKTPIDFLVDSQIATGPDAGAFPASFDPGKPNVHATQEAVRALTGTGYVVDPDKRRPAPTIADGTVVPQALVIDAGIDATGKRDLRMCRVMAPAGASLTALLQAAASSAQPAGCVSGLSIVDGRVRALNGVTGDHAQRRWLVRIGGGAAEHAAGQPVCAGRIISLYVGRTADAGAPTNVPCTAPAPSVDPKPQPSSPAQPAAPSTPAPPTKRAPAPIARIAVRGRSGKNRSVRLDRKGRLRVTLSCPKTATNGCWSVLSARAKYRTSPRSEARDRRVGGRTIRLAAGRKRTVAVSLSTKLRRDLRRVGHRSVRLIVSTHGNDASTRSRTTSRVTVRPVARRAKR